MTGARGFRLAVWLIVMAACITIIARTRLDTDMSAFLPHSPSTAQRVLVDQVQHGVLSRLILLAVEGAPPETLAALSRTLTERLAGADAFATVDDGARGAFGKEEDFIWRNRYLLSPNVRPERFTAAGLRAALEKDLRLLATDFAPLETNVLANDPTGEVTSLADQFTGAARPHTRDGVWFSSDDHRALLVVQLRAGMFDIDAQQHALTLIHDRFVNVKRDIPAAAQARLLETGPPVFAVRTRATMEADATRFSLLATIIVAGVLLFAYRSIGLLFLCLLPVISGALAGIAAVALGFGFVHGITLGFGVTLIGESVDYAIYLITQTEPGSAPDDTLSRIGSTLRLGMFTSIAGFSAMLFSSFTGFAQLGLFSISGLVCALSVTRWILPALLPKRFPVIKSGVFAPPLLQVMRHARWLRLPLVLLALASAALLFFHHGSFWQNDLTSMSPIPAADQKLDQQLRHDLGTPDIRYLVVANAANEQQALAASDRLAQLLTPLVTQKLLSGFDAPSRYLPSEEVQRARQAALPSADVLSGNLHQALAGLPFRPELFAPFLQDVAAAKAAAPLTRASLPLSLSLKLDSMLSEQQGEWTVMLPLRGVVAAQRVAAQVAGLNEPGVVFVDLARESDRLLRTYQHEAMTLAAIGSLIILILLSAALRSPRRVFVVVAPLAAAVVFTAALLSIGGQKLSIFNLVGLLLIAAVGSNYCLFFERLNRDRRHRERAVASLVLANLCTVIGYGILSFSGIPVLHDIGVTVAIGTVSSLVFAAILSPADGVHNDLAVAS